MPKSKKALEALAPNSVEKREATRAQNLCGKCLASVPIGKQFAVLNDLDKGKVIVAPAKEHPTKSHYCADCKDVRVQMKETWLGQRDETPAKSKPKGKKAAAKKGAKKAPAKKAAKGKGKKAPAKKGGRKKAAASAAEPF